MPAIQSCDPSAHGRAYNTLFLSLRGVSMEIRWDWDHVSTYPECDGPLVDGTGGWAISATNNDMVAYYAHATRKNGQPTTYRLDAGRTVTLTAAQAASGGYGVVSDFADLTLTTTP